MDAQSVFRAEYVLSTLDKVTNWARQGSMWPMTFGEQPELRTVCRDRANVMVYAARSCLLCGRDDAHGCRSV